MSHNKLGIHKDISAKYQSRPSTINQFDSAIPGQEHSHEAEEDEEPESSEQVGHPVGKVILGLAREERQRDEEPEGQDEGLDDDVGAVEWSHDADCVGFQGGEGGEEEEIGRVAFPFPVCEKHADESADQRHDHQPWVGLDPIPVAVVEEWDGAEDRGEEKLDGAVA